MGCQFSKPNILEDYPKSSNDYDSIKSSEVIDPINTSRNSTANLSINYEIKNEIENGELIANFIKEFDEELPLYILFKPTVIIF